LIFRYDVDLITNSVVGSKLSKNMNIGAAHCHL